MTRGSRGGMPCDWLESNRRLCGRCRAPPHALGCATTVHATPTGGDRRRAGEAARGGRHRMPGHSTARHRPETARAATTREGASGARRSWRAGAGVLKCPGSRHETILCCVRS